MSRSTTIYLQIVKTPRYLGNIGHIFSLISNSVNLHIVVMGQSLGLIQSWAQLFYKQLL